MYHSNDCIDFKLNLENNNPTLTLRRKAVFVFDYLTPRLLTQFLVLHFNAMLDIIIIIICVRKVRKVGDYYGV